MALAHLTLTPVRGWCADSPLHRVQLRGEVERLRTLVALLKEENDLLRSRQGQMPAASRNHYTPVERLRILQHKAARCWNNSQTARAFLVAPSTIAEWMRRLEEDGQTEFLKPRFPVNKFPEYVNHVIQDFNARFPHLGKKQIADMIARLSLHVSASHVGRQLKKRLFGRPPPKQRAAHPGEASVGAEPVASDQAQRTVTADAPNSLWHIDITVVSTAQGFAVPWFPFSLPNVWPLSWHVGVVLDHFSRKVLATGVFFREPSSAQMCVLMQRAVDNAGALPRHIVSDKGCQFHGRDEDTQYQLWCKQRGIRMRFGAVGRKGSIAVVERFILSLKTEHLRRVLVPFGVRQMAALVDAYARWYNVHRPHTALGGRTPDEVFDGLPAASEAPRFEPRKCYPLRRAPSRSAPKAVRGRRGVRLELVNGHFEDQAHLPLPTLRRVA